MVERHYTFEVDDEIIGVFSEEAKIDFLVLLDKNSDLKTAVKIIELEIAYWIDIQNSDEKEYYGNMGYRNLVDSALKAFGFNPRYYDFVEI